MRVIHPLILLIAFSWLLFSCSAEQSKSSRQKVEIVDATSLRQDSVHLASKQWLKRGWFNTVANRFEFTVGDSVAIPDFENKRLKRITQHHLTDNELVQFNDSVYADYFYTPNRIFNLHKDTVVSKELPEIYFFENKYYYPLITSHNDFVLKPNGKILGQLLYTSKDKYVSSVDSLFSYSNQCRLGQFVLKDDSLVLDSLVDIYPRKPFLLNDERCLSVESYIITAKDGFYAAFNFLDSIYYYDFNGNILDTIGLPDELNFTYFKRDMSIKEQTSDQIKQSEFNGHKIRRMFYDEPRQQLALIITEHLDIEAAFEPSFDGIAWYVAFYDIKNKKWKKLVRFTAAHNKRYLIFSDEGFYISRLPSNPFILDRYAY